MKDLRLGENEGMEALYVLTRFTNRFMHGLKEWENQKTENQCNTGFKIFRDTVVTGDNSVVMEDRISRNWEKPTICLIPLKFMAG